MKKKKDVGGRPSVMTEAVLLKLEQAFAIDSTVEEACSYADISRDAFYDYIKKNPKFSDRIADLRQRPILLARQTIVSGLNSPEHARWYLERKRKKEFSSRTELTGEDGKDLPTPILANLNVSNNNSNKKDSGTE